MADLLIPRNSEALLGAVVAFKRICHVLLVELEANNVSQSRIDELKSQLLSEFLNMDGFGLSMGEEIGAMDIAINVLDNVFSDD